MGRAQICLCSCHRNRQHHLIIPFLLFLVSSLTVVRFVAEGRAITNLLDEKGVEMVRSQTIGSRPPRCERMCSSCGHCEAIQVPVTTEAQRHRRRSSHLTNSDAVSTIAYSRGDDLTNYKPMSWKCKCGNTIFNP